MSRYFIAIYLLLFFVSSCSDEKVIVDTNDSWYVFASVENPSPELIKLEYPSGKITETNIYEKANNEKLVSAPEVIYEFGGLFFLLQPEEYRILVINKRTYQKSAEIEFKSEGRKPSAMAFANATTAYVIFKDDSVVKAVDLTVMQEAKTIELPSITASIAVAVNQVYIACPTQDRIFVLDTRDNQITKEIPVPDFPVLVTFTYDGLNAVVVSAGYGKYDTTEDKTSAYVTYIDRGTHTEIARQPLGIGIVNPIEQIPLTVATASRLYAFIGTQEYFLRFNTRTAGSVARVSNGNYPSVIYNAKRDEMLLIKKEGDVKYLITSTPEQYKEIMQKELPTGVVSVLPL